VSNHPAPKPELPSPQAEPGKTGEAIQLDPEIRPQVRLSLETFRRDLPMLLKRRLFRKWVAYRGTEQIGIARSHDKLLKECKRRSYQDDEYIIRCIVPELEDCDSTPLYEP